MRGRKKLLDDAQGLTIWIDAPTWNKLMRLKKQKKIKSVSSYLRQLIYKDLELDSSQ